MGGYGMKIDLSASRPVIEADNLPDLVEAYIVDARLRTKEHTAAGYDYLLSLFLEWWGGYGPTVDHILDVKGWAAFEAWLYRRKSKQSGKPLALNTRHKCIDRCKQMLKWAHRLGYLDRDFSDQIAAARGAPPLRVVPGIDDLRRLLEAAGESYRPTRDRAIVAVLAGTGIRRAEAAAVNVEDVEFHADLSGVLRVRKAKLDKPRTVVFDTACGEYLTALIDELGRPTGPLFTGWKDRRLSAERLAEAVKKALRAAGIDERGRGPHDLRRMFATEWARQRRGIGDAKLLSMQMGHSGEQMTSLYIRQSLDDLKAGFESPLGKL